MRRLNVIGLNSGTSMDGIDCALFSIAPDKAHSDSGSVSLNIELLRSCLYPFEPTFRRRLQTTVAASQVSWEHVCLLNTALGEVFANAAGLIMREARAYRGVEADLIGSHGQTIWHAPAKKAFWGVKTSGTLQLGEPAIIAARTGLPVVADFRTADMAVGGEGAPLVCFADEVLFGKDGIPTGVLNIGGIANITILDGSGGAQMAFDTGPGNMLMDRAAELLLDKTYDENGENARLGHVDKEWLQNLNAHPYLQRTPPKTTGREQFGYAFADREIEEAGKRGLTNQDVLATLTAFTASSIATAYKEFVLPPRGSTRIERLVVGGGGADNAYLLELLSQSFPHPIKISRHEEFGISTKFKEALLFALLAYTTYFGVPNNVPACTGASRRVCLGKIVCPPVAASIGGPSNARLFRV